MENAHKRTSNQNNSSINNLAEVVAGIASQQRPKISAILKPASTITLMFDGKNKKTKLLKDLFHTMPKMQPELTKATKINHFYANLRKKSLQIFQNKNANNKRTL